MPTAQEIKSSILSLLADNTTQDISPADIRGILTDIVDTMGAGEYTSLDIEWDVSTTYAEDEVVTFMDRLWQSKSAGNTGNQPPSNPETTEDTYWIEQSQAPSSPVTEWQAGVYGSGLVCVFYEGALYKLENATRPYTSTNMLTEILSGDWVEVGWPMSKYGILLLKNTTSQIYQTGKLSVNYDSGYYFVRKSTNEILLKIKDTSGMELLAKSKIKSIKVTLSEAQVKALASTPITGLIPAPGAEKYIKVISTSARIKENGIPHDNLNHLILRYDSHSGASDEVSYISGSTGSFLQAAAEEVRELRNMGADGAKIAVNDSMGLYATGSDSTQDGGGLDLFILFSEVDMS